MSDYLFVQSQNPFTEGQTELQYALASQLHRAGHNVTLLLIQNGVTPAQIGARRTGLDTLLDLGVLVLADGFSLKLRNISADDLKFPIWISNVEVAIDALTEGQKVIWN
ncbi:hypothetical protein RE428_31190 [Marinobacter nanhaiticus D15-8W]|uniref:Multidrug transporter n=1 Tax=Marinobacter nanhaiticus D15-8W TaxID=626887 RepID=N6W400_9GAMM|nr:DsrE family protein [Marinobacter nanhaiticus]ENO17235.1 multidrug transporter [Marinobacter nanhaiticus D15-8W]BES72101.1 hypothetical protein RE428_31190 [Marinobacter nanhaiticus D15-8W]